MQLTTRLQPKLNEVVGILKNSEWVLGSNLRQIVKLDSTPTEKVDFSKIMRFLVAQGQVESMKGGYNNWGLLYKMSSNSRVPEKYDFENRQLTSEERELVDKTFKTLKSLVTRYQNNVAIHMSHISNEEKETWEWLCNGLSIPEQLI